MAGDDDPIEQLVQVADGVTAAETAYATTTEKLDVLDRAREQVQAEIDRLRQVIRMLCKVLIERGQLEPGHRKLVDRLLSTSNPQRVVRLRVVNDKHDTSGPAIDCASRLHLCRGRCCTFLVTLAEEDIADGVRWHIDQPYMLLHDEDRYCHHIDRDSGGCTIYDKRPAACRAFDCRHDERIWLDFEAGVPAPLGFHLEEHLLPRFAR